MMAFLCKVFTCKSKGTKAKTIENGNSMKMRENNNKKFEYLQVKRKKLQSIKDVIENLDYINRRIKHTVESNYRYIIPTSELIKIHEMIVREQYTPLDKIHNESFIFKNRKKLKKNFNTSEISLVTREIMDTLLQGLDFDYIIQVPYEQGKPIILRDATVYHEHEFLNQRKEKIKNFDSENNIDRGIILNSAIEIDMSSLSSEEDAETKKEQIIRLTSNSPIFKKKNKNFKDIKSKAANDNTSSLNIVLASPRNTLKRNSQSTSNAISDKSTNITKKTNSVLFQTKMEIHDNLMLKPRGLYNPSVYCFMNTCLQCLISIPELNHYFTSSTYSVEKKQKKGTPNCNAYKELIDNYESASDSLKAPSSLYKVCHSFLEPNQQHDCQEFLRRFLTKIQEELNFNRKYTIPDKTSFLKAWNIYTEANPSFVDSIFTGLMRSSVICNKCGYKSDTYDPFMDLSVPIKKKQVESLDNCLDNYFAKENIECEYKCSNCKKLTSISKKLEIVISPPILTIHFKRFEDLHHKFNGSIEFSDTLDLLTYTSLEVYDTLNYELFAVAVHLGRSIFSGHYVAYAKRYGKWYNFNDSSVFSAGIQEALSNNAYILFFRRLEN